MADLRTLLRVVAAAVCLAAVAVTPVSADPVASEPAAPASFVGAQGTTFTLGGQPFRFVGANMYNAAGDPATYECGPWMERPEVELDDWFRRARTEFDGQVIRFWAFQSYTKGGTDWRGLDRVFRLANKHGIKVVPVLENQWEDCTQGGYKTEAWYAEGYSRPYGAYPLSFSDYVTRVVTRYADEPAIAAWMLMNEAESKSPTGHPAPEALYSFTRDASALVKRLDPNHLVTLGVMGSGQPGVNETSFDRLHALETIDFLEYHDYHENDEPLPGLNGGSHSTTHNTLAAALRKAVALDKPLLIGEAGMSISSCTRLSGWQLETPQTRAQKFDAKLRSFFAQGGAGYLVWTWTPNQACDHDFTSGDPLNAVLAQQASALREISTFGAP